MEKKLKPSAFEHSFIAMPSPQGYCLLAPQPRLINDYPVWANIRIGTKSGGWSISGRQKIPDLLLINQDTNEQLYVEVSSLGESKTEKMLILRLGASQICCGELTPM